jgi:curved DNA-binding protein CbpA
MANMIETFPVPLILKKILKDSLSGELTVKGKNFTKHLTFSKGELECAVSDMVRERLGEILCSTGKITREQLIMLRKMKENAEEKFGKLLVKHKIMNKQELFLALQDQIKTIAISIFSMSSGEWTFKVGEPVEPPSFQKFKLNLPEIIIAGSREITDFSYYKRRYLYRAPVTLPIPESLGQLLSPDDIRFYLKLSKCNIIATEQIFLMMEMEEKLFWQQLSMLYLLNFIDFTEFRIDSNLHRNLGIIDELHEKLKADTIDHYQLLELKDTASVSDVKDKYFAFTKKYTPEILKTAPDSRAEEKTEFVIEKAAQAFDTLSNEEKKKAYDTGQHKKTEIAAQINENADIQTRNEDKKARYEKAKTFYLRAHSLYEESRYHDAVRLMEEAVRLDDSRPSYFLLLGLVQSRIPEYRPYAEKNLRKAAVLEPWNADPVFYLGQLYWSEKLFKKAEREYRKALEINMEHTLAAKMINKIEKQLKKPGTFSFFHKK